LNVRHGKAPFLIAKPSISMGHFPIPTPSPLPKSSHLPAQQVQRGHHTGGAAGCEGMKETGEEPTQASCPDTLWQ